MSNMIVSVAGPPAASTRTPVACTLIGRPSMVRASKSRTGTPSPTGSCSSWAMRSRARCRDSPGGCSSDHAHALHRLGVGEAEQARGRRVGIEDDALAVQEDRRGRALEQLAVARLAGGEGALGADLVGDVAGHAAVAVEHAFRRVARLAADAVQPRPALRIAAAHDQAAERPARLEVGAVPVELRLAHADVRQLPGRVAELPVERAPVGRRRGVGDVGEAEVAVLLPVPVGHQAERVARAARQQLGVAQPLAEDAHRERARHQGRAGAEREQAERGAGRQAADLEQQAERGERASTAAATATTARAGHGGRGSGALRCCAAAICRSAEGRYSGPTPARRVPPPRRDARRGRNRRPLRRPDRARRATS